MGEMNEAGLPRRATLEQRLLDALSSIAEHSSEFASVEDAETMVVRMTEKAREAVEMAWREHAEGALAELKQDPSQG